MRLLFVHEVFGALGGAEANAQITASEFSKRGHTVGLIHGPGTGKAESLWRETFSARFPLEGADRSKTVREAIGRFCPEAIYVHKMGDVGVLEALVGSRVPLVRMVHDHDLYCMRSYKYNVFTRRICTRPVSARCLFPCGAFLVRDRGSAWGMKYVSYREKEREVRLNQQFHRLVVVTEYMRQELLRNGFAAEKIEIHPPVPRGVAGGVRSTFSERNLLIYAGQIIRGKGVDVLLEALVRVGVPFECVIFGDGHYRAYCQGLRDRLGLKDRVRFEGYVTQEELANHYRECSVVLISSVWPEPIATIGLEVMRYGLPVVAFDAGGIGDWLTDGYNGYLVPWMDREEFALRIEQLLLDKSLARQLGENGLRRASERYDFEVYITDLERMFLAVIRERRGLGRGERFGLEGGAPAGGGRESLMRLLGNSTGNESVERPDCGGEQF